MELYLKREEHPERTFGKYYKENVYIGESLEDPVLPEGKVELGKMAIPYGRYRLVISYSNRFKKQMIQVVNVRGSNILFHGVPIDACGIRIHGGNDVEDTLGCPLAGKIRTATGIANCAGVVQQLFDIVKKHDETEEVYLNIVKA